MWSNDENTTPITLFFYYVRGWCAQLQFNKYATYSLHKLCDSQYSADNCDSCAISQMKSHNFRLPSLIDTIHDDTWLLLSGMPKFCSLVNVDIVMRYAYKSPWAMSCVNKSDSIVHIIICGGVNEVEGKKIVHELWLIVAFFP